MLFVGIDVKGGLFLYFYKILGRIFLGDRWAFLQLSFCCALLQKRYTHIVLPYAANRDPFVQLPRDMWDWLRNTRGQHEGHGPQPPLLRAQLCAGKGVQIAYVIGAVPGLPHTRPEFRVPRLDEA